MGRKGLLIGGALVTLLLVQAFVIYLWLHNRPAAVCEREGGRWNATFQGCETIREASPTSSA